MSEAVFRLAGIVRSFPQGRSTLEILKGVDLHVAKGEIIALIGPSGAGKSTLLHIAGLLERPTAGEVYVGGRACGSLSETERTLLRRSTFGFVYQYHHLLPEFSALENVMLPQFIAGIGAAQAKARARRLLAELGLSERERHRPGQLSGGEQQRVAMARALANAPEILLADEPTGNLDPATADDVFALLLALARTEGLTAIIATHNPSLAERMDRTVLLDRGRLVSAPAALARYGTDKR